MRLCGGVAQGLLDLPQNAYHEIPRYMCVRGAIRGRPGKVQSADLTCDVIKKVAP